MTRDWHFSDDSSICLLRAAGVLLRDGKILTQCDKSVYALPGGHVQIGETFEEALMREYREEVGVNIICDRLIWIEETFWRHENKDANAVVFYYLISLENDADLCECEPMTQNNNENITLKWIPIEELKHLEIHPSFIKERINSIPKMTEHIISFE